MPATHAEAAPAAIIRPADPSAESWIEALTVWAVIDFDRAQSALEAADLAMLGDPGSLGLGRAFEIAADRFDDAMASLIDLLEVREGRAFGHRGRVYRAVENDFLEPPCPLVVIVEDDDTGL